MPSPNFHQIFTVVWSAFALYWLIAALRIKRAKASEGPSRILHLALLGAALLLLFSSHDSSFGPLSRYFLPHTQAVALVGLALTFAGLALAVWARVHLGQNWSSRVTLKVDHELIRSGPYAHLRHPIYSGMLLAMLGTGIAQGEWRGLLAFCLALLSFWIKASREDAWLTREFGASFEAHRRHAGFLLPRW